MMKFDLVSLYVYFTSFTFMTVCNRINTTTNIIVVVDQVVMLCDVVCVHPRV